MFDLSESSTFNYEMLFNSRLEHRVNREQIRIIQLSMIRRLILRFDINLSLLKIHCLVSFNNNDGNYLFMICYLNY